MVQWAPPRAAAPGDGPTMHTAFEHSSALVTQLRKTLDAISAYAWYAAPSGALIFVNKRTADYLGLPQDHPLRHGIDTGAAWDCHIPLLHPDDQEGSRTAWSNCLRTGSVGEVSFRIRNARGEYRWFVSRAEPIRESDGTLLYWVGINRDIEECKQTEFYLLQGQRLTQTGSWAFNADGFEYWSSQLFEIHGLEPSINTPGIPQYMELIHPDDRDFVARVIRKMLSDRQGFDFTKRIVRPDGVIRHVRCVGIPTADGRGFVGTGMDVTEQEQLTKALRESQEELRQVLDLAPQLIAVFGPRRERLYVNRGALAYFGTSLEQWRQDNVGSEVHPDDVERAKAAAKHGMATRSSYELELRIRKGDGTYRWFLARYSLLCDEQGQPTRWFLACTDIEDRKRTEERLQQENATLREDIDQASMFEEIVGSSPSLRKVLAQVNKVALSDSTVLILGETGTGKELIARAIHKRSKRAGRAFIGVNCGAIPASLIASELFGHEKGAFTGATHRRLGRFEAAHGGTIFLDEVGDLPADIQIALLRVLQEREIERVGSNKPIPVDVRVLAATHCDLDRLVSEGRFRQDLFYRLNVVPIPMPALRERATDIPVLVEYFLARFGKKLGKKFLGIEKKTLAVLQAYDWPGNVRELQNVIERAVTLSDSDTFTVDAAWLKRQPAQPPQISVALNGVLSAHEKEAIETALAQSHGRVSGPAGAAARLGVPTSTLDSKIKRLRIDKYRFFGKSR